MKTVTFKQFLHILEEGTAEDIAKLQADISMVDTAIAQRTTPLTQRKIQLQKLLMQKQKQQQAEAQRNPSTDQQQGQPITTTTTPGSAGAATPGSAASTHAAAA